VGYILQRKWYELGRVGSLLEKFTTLLLCVRGYQFSFATFVPGTNNSLFASINDHLYANKRRYTSPTDCFHVAATPSASRNSGATRFLCFSSLFCFFSLFRAVQINLTSSYTVAA